MFAVPFQRSFKYLHEDVELNILYRENIKKLVEFVEMYQNHRINIEIPPHYMYGNPFEKLKQDILVVKGHTPEAQIVLNIKFVSLANPVNFLQEITEKMPCPYFFGSAIENLDLFHKLLSLGVTDIFIGGQLGFFVKNLAKVAKQKGVRLRAYCDVSQPLYTSLPSYKTFFVRPEDIEFYSKYIDVFEFYRTERLNTMYEIYTKDRQWAGLLKDLIYGYSGEEDSRNISPFMAEIRAKCGKKCLYKDCTICDQEMRLNKLFTNSHLLPVVFKTKEDSET